MELSILQKFRDEECPSTLEKVGGKFLSTMKQEELVDIAGKKNVDVLNLCRLGGIDPNTENLTKLVHFILATEKEASCRNDKKRKGGEQDGEKSEFNELMAKVARLEKAVEDKAVENEKAELERMKRETKETANAQKADEMVDKESCSIPQHELHKINKRMEQLDNVINSSNYAKQKTKLEQDLLEFLQKLDRNKSLANAMPEDIRMFIVDRERHGRTQLHGSSCNFKGAHGKQKCECQITMASKSVDSLVGKIRAIFRDFGRSGDWNESDKSGNPASSIIFKKHIRALEVEQARFEVPTKQAVPLMFNKLGDLSRHLSYSIAIQKDKVAKFLLLRDRSYFTFIAHSGNRANDLSVLTLKRIFYLQNKDGIFVSQNAGKTASIHNTHNYIIYRSKDPDICPILHLEEYVKFAKTINIDLEEGFLFRVRDSIRREIINRPVSTASMADRLKSHLTAINLYEGESAHSARRGCAITLRLLGIKDEDVSAHIGWKSEGMVGHYAHAGKLCQVDNVASRLSFAASRTEKNFTSSLENASFGLTNLSNFTKFCPE